MRISTPTKPWVEKSAAQRLADDDGKEPATPKSMNALPTFSAIEGLNTFERDDPELYRSFEDVVGALRTEILPDEALTKLAEAIPDSLKRELVYRWSSMEKSIVVSLKQQLALVDTIINSFIDDGQVISGERNGMTAKDAVNMSLRLASTLASHLPKLVKADRVQRLESALFQVVRESLTKDQQAEVLARLEEMDRKVNRD